MTYTANNTVRQDKDNTAYCRKCKGRPKYDKYLQIICFMWDFSTTELKIAITFNPIVLYDIVSIIPLHGKQSNNLDENACKNRSNG